LGGEPAAGGLWLASAGMLVPAPLVVVVAGVVEVVDAVVLVPPPLLPLVVSLPLLIS
jgi:hypothetical protein